jgi:hypothetical protein
MNARMAGRHFLQIPGPTDVPGRILRAISEPTIDHRGPDFAALGPAGGQVRTKPVERDFEGGETCAREAPKP